MKMCEWIYSFLKTRLSKKSDFGTREKNTFKVPTHKKEKIPWQQELIHRTLMYIPIKKSIFLQLLALTSYLQHFCNQQQLLQELVMTNTMQRADIFSF